jgi:hypothetical protein
VRTKENWRIKEERQVKEGTEEGTEREIRRECMEM